MNSLHRFVFVSVVICLFLTVIVNAVAEEIVVEIDGQGSVRGTTIPSAGAGGKIFFAFRGIPYAEPPVDQLRFKPPVPKTSWKESGHILDATKDGPVCPQIDLMQQQFIGQEDCLYLNVYTPHMPSELKSVKLPVLVFIHGGGFRFGFSSSWTYGPQKLMDSGIVIVTINYRLGAVGYLSTEDEASPGNYGLWDQREALRWIQVNIETFGGDPTYVTLMGHSAGSASVFYQSISKLSEGLFHQAIPMSGTPMCTWAHATDSTYWAKRLARDFHCPTSKTAELVECLRTVSVQEIVEKSETYINETLIPFAPNVDGTLITGDPKQMLVDKDIANKVPVLMGITKDEGAGFYGLVNYHLVNFSEEMFKFNVRSCLNNRQADVPDVLNLIVEHYFQNGPPTDEVDAAKSLAKMFTDGMMKMCHYSGMSYLIEAGIDVYAYSYDYVSEISVLQFLGIKEHLGVAHGDELPMIFSMLAGGTDNDSEKTKIITKRIITLITNFVKFGNPTIDDLDHVAWPLSISPDDVQVYHIDEPPSVTKLNPFEDPHMDLWLRDIPEAIELTKQSFKDEL